MTLLKSLIKRLLFFVPSSVLCSMHFELTSSLGRWQSKPLVLRPEGRKYINLGSGTDVIEGFINIDFFNTRGIDYGADLRYPLKIASNVVDGIICEHTLEHLTYLQVYQVMQECHRILKPGGVLRIILPDLSVFMQNYCQGNREWFSRWESLMFCTSSDSERSVRRLETPMEAISFVTQEYGHVSCWDVETVTAYLKKSGFLYTSVTEFRQGHCTELLVDRDDVDRRFVSLYVEAVKQADVR